MTTRPAPLTIAGPGLAINVGNTRIALGIFGPDGLIDTFRLSSRVDRTEDEVSATVSAFLGPHAELLAGGWAGVASVVPARTASYLALASRWTGREPYPVRGDHVPGLVLDVPDPGSVGADRIANAAAAAERSPLPCIVVDLGTATHFEVVTEGPTFAGGIIAPGVLTASDALFAGTARLAAVEFERPSRILGRSTRECLQSGIFHGALAQIEGLIVALRRELAEAGRAGSGRSSGKIPILTTGGLAPVLAPESRLLREVVPELTLEGIALLAFRAGRR